MSQVANTTRTIHSGQWELKCLSAPCELREPFSSWFHTDSLLNLWNYAGASYIQRLKTDLCRFLAFFRSFLFKTLPSTSTCLSLPERYSASFIQQDPLVIWDSPPKPPPGRGFQAESQGNHRAPFVCLP